MNKKYIRQVHRNQAQYKQGLGLIAVVIIFAILLGGGYLFARKAGYFPETAPSDIIQPNPIGFESQAECEQKTSETCHFECGGPVSSGNGWETASCDFAKWIP